MSDLSAAFDAAGRMACPDLTQLNPDSAAGFGLRPALICGDSHSAFYMRPEMIAAGVFPLHAFCSGGSAAGLVNQNSKSQYGQHIRRFFEMRDYESLKRFRFFLFKFGQVDLEFVYTYRRMTSGSTRPDMADYIDFADVAASKYVAFLDSLIIRSDAPLVACSVFPPSLLNSNIVQGYANAHIAFLENQADATALSEGLASLQYNSLEERTEVHRAFNTRLAQECAQRDIVFFDDFSPFIDPTTGTVDLRYIEIGNGTDHHLDFHGPEMKAASIPLFAKLNQALERIDLL